MRLFLFLFLLLSTNINAFAKTEDGTSVAQPISAYGTTTDGVIVPLQVSSDGTVVTSGGGGGGGSPGGSNPQLQYNNAGSFGGITGSGVVASNVGIGTASPHAKLEVTNTTTANSFQVNDASPDTTPFIIDFNGDVGFGLQPSNAKVDIQPSTATLLDSTPAGMLWAKGTWSATDDTTNPQIHGIYSEPHFSGTFNGGTLSGFYTQAYNNATAGDTSHHLAIVGRAITTSTATADLSSGFWGDVQLTGAGTITEAATYYASKNIVSAGTMTQSEGFNANKPQVTGTGALVNAYGFLSPSGFASSPVASNNNIDAVFGGAPVGPVNATLYIGSGHVVLGNASNIGIGTSLPTRPLQTFAFDSNTVITTAGKSSIGMLNSHQTNGTFTDVAFESVDSNGALVLGSKITGVTTSHTAGAVSGDTVFLNKNAGTTAERMRIYSNGNVGIGTTASRGTLDLGVTGTIWGDGSNLTGIGGAISGLTTTYVPKAGSSTTIVNSQIFDDGTNVGIGTTTASALLQVGTNVKFSSTGTIRGAGGSASSPEFSSNSSTNAGFYIPTTNVAAIATSSTERIRFDSTGNVGISTATVSGKFVVYNPAASLGWTVQTAANTACNTTCTGHGACAFGEDTSVIGTLVACTDATADVCICAGP